MSFLSKITPDALTEFNDGVQRMLDPINPLVTNLTDKNKAIAELLFNAGVTAEEIGDFVDVSKAQLNPYMEELALKAKIKAELLEEMKTTKK